MTYFSSRRNEKTSLATTGKRGFLDGGEGEIRTLEPISGLRDFQSRALDQLRDFSSRCGLQHNYYSTFFSVCQ